MLNDVEPRTEIFVDANIFYLKKNWDIIKELNKAWSAMGTIKRIENLRIVEIDRETFDTALGYSKNYCLLSNDAIHVATMKKYGITNIATNDPDFERVDWINVWKP